MCVVTAESAEYALPFLRTLSVLMAYPTMRVRVA
jgi:hypothetical protein